MLLRYSPSRYEIPRVFLIEPVKKKVFGRTETGRKSRLCKKTETRWREVLHIFRTRFILVIPVGSLLQIYRRLDETLGPVYREIILIATHARFNPLTHLIPYAFPAPTVY